MKLTSNQKKQLRKALQDAFPKPIKLERMLVEENLEEFKDVINGDDLSDIIFNLIKKAESDGKIEELISGACEGNPGNPELKAFVDKWEKEKKQQTTTMVIKTGYPIPIHPIIATNKNAKDASQIPICIRLSYQNGRNCIVPSKSGSLKDLHEELKTLFKNHERDTGIKFVLDLTKPFVRSLNTIIGDYNSLDEKIVICCPLHYIRYIRDSSSNFEPRKEEGELLKLIYKIELSDCGSKKQLYSGLIRKFYEKYTDSLTRNRAKINIYTNVRSAAFLWFGYIKNKTYRQKASQTIDEPTY